MAVTVSFTSRRKALELVTPARPTPHEYKAVSDIDDQRGLRYYPAGVEYFRCHRDAVRDMADHPAAMIRAALAEALVSYYPLAGRLVELPADDAGGKLLVDCTAEGVVFVEADADVGLEDLGQQALAPPYPCVEELLCHDIGEPQEVVVGKPLLFLQVTRFLNNDGFSIGYRYCHSVIDGFGMAQLLDDIYRLARGEPLAVLPVWERDLLTARAPRSVVTHKHAAYDKLPATTAAAAEDVIWKTPLAQMVTRYFRLDMKLIAAIRSQLPARLRGAATTFELVAAAAWRCRAAALEYPPGQPVRVMFLSNARGSWKPRSPLPEGFYGNALVLRTAEAAADELCGRPLGHAVERVRGAKFDVTDGYVKSLLDTLVQRGRPFHPLEWTYLVADASSLSRRAASLGGWERAGGGVTTAGRVLPTSLQSYYDRCERGGGEEFVALSMCLPPAAMERFAERIAVWPNESVVMSSL